MPITRTRSLDVFRGLTVALMILVNNPGTWAHIYAPFEHAKWHGYTLTDLVFPFFLFAVGNAMALAPLKGARVVKRMALIFLIGLVLNWLPFALWRGDELILKSWTWTDIHGQIQGIRILGVLQRIALAYGCAGAILLFFQKRALPIALGILGLNSLLGFWLGNSTDPWSLEGFYGTSIDRLLLSPQHLYQGEGVAFDPEGLMSTIGGVAQVLLGFWCGQKVVEFARAKATATEGSKEFKFLICSAIAFIALGYLWSPLQPINKKIWTSSYVLVTTGWALLVLTALEYRSITSPLFEAFGKNPLFVYVLSGFIPRMLSLIRLPGGLNPDGTPHYLTPFNWTYENVFARVPGPAENGSLVYAVVMVAFYAWVAVTLDRKKIYIRV